MRKHSRILLSSFLAVYVGLMSAAGATDAPRRLHDQLAIRIAPHAPQPIRPSITLYAVASPNAGATYALPIARQQRAIAIAMPAPEPTKLETTVDGSPSSDSWAFKLASSLFGNQLLDWFEQLYIDNTLDQE